MMKGCLSAAIAALLFGAACTPQGDPGIAREGFTDDFEREKLGKHWKNTGGPYRIENGTLRIRGAKNKPLWLRRTLPRDVRIAFDVKSDSPEGDIKVELYGDGASKATQDSYTATSYVVIFGGWGNSKNMIARLDEHGKDTAQGPARKVVPGKTYKFVVERRGSHIKATVDGELLAEYDDSSPLWGRGHDHFAFNNWESDLTFDNLVIKPL